MGEPVVGYDVFGLYMYRDFKETTYTRTSSNLVDLLSNIGGLISVITVLIGMSVQEF